ncbi:putative ubiquitin-conjugating enzyme E2 23 [Drosera capensis]
MASSSSSSSSSSFARFDIVISADSVSDHLHATKPHYPSSIAKISKTITKEWKHLEENLPDSIFVRVYENRIDLMRAAIVGAKGTPYADFLFFFDVAIPWDYPSSPPQVNYRSAGFRVNPNLYANGKVCLSLLGTWSGRNVEKWHSKRSNILQVLLSIQALVLNQRPFFNEPRFHFLTGQRWEEESLAYNENAFLLCCRTTLALLRTPPKHFEPLVTSHFREHGTTILKTCVKQFNKPSIPRTRTATPNSTEKFKESLVIVYPQLRIAFEGTGASLRDLPPQLGPTPGKETGQHAVAVKPATKPMQKPGTTEVVTGKVKEKPTQKPGTTKGVIEKVMEIFLGFIKGKSTGNDVVKIPGAG